MADKLWAMNEHPYGWLSLIPSCVAIVLAIATRRVIVSILAGIFVGAVITHGGNPIPAVGDTLEIHLWKTLTEENRLRVFAFTVLMGAMVGVIQRSGGMQGLVDAVTPWAKNRRRAQLTTWLLGLLVFFDDYANSVLLGNTLRSLFDRLRISREKLAYLVDSTAAPVSGLAIISTWVAGEIRFIEDGLANVAVPSQLGAFELFIQTIPYRFYVLFALVFVVLVASLNRDFGPMWAAERRCLDQTTGRADSGSRHVQPSTGWWNAVIPVVVTVLAVLWLLLATGWQGLDAENHNGQVSLWEVFGAADSYYALLWGSLAGLVTAVVLTVAQRLLTLDEISAAVASGARLMLPALGVLWLASALSAMTGNEPPSGMLTSATDTPFPLREYRLYTGEFLAGLVAGDGAESPSRMLAIGLPTLIFVLAAGISFATGTSWGTMAIVMPVAIPLAHGVVSETASASWSAEPLVICTIGSVLAGAIFGDHCSPISDTTVLSSQACACDHTAHVWTQLPYACLVGAVAIVCGTLPIGFGVSVWFLLPAGIVALVFLLWVLGRPVDGHTKL